MPDSGIARARKDRLQFRQKLGKIQMAMAIHKHGRTLSEGR
jgi:hypothetical protein